MLLRTEENRARSDTNDIRPEPVRPSEALLIEEFRRDRVRAGDRVLCTSLGRAQLAVEIAKGVPSAPVTAAFFDQHLVQRARESLQKPLANLKIDCFADLPAGPFERVALPFQPAGDAELAQELLQQGYVALNERGKLFASTSEPRDRWLAGRMAALFGEEDVERREMAGGVVYIGVRHGELKRPRQFEAGYAFRDHGRMISITTRPGVFSHRHLDLGARALIESMDATDDDGERQLVAPGARVLDLGCGAGEVGIAAALRAPSVHVHFVDSMLRALECAFKGCETNGVKGATFELSADGRIEGAGKFDLVLANPPYYSHYRIAEIFVQAAVAALKPKGRAHFVTKHPRWFEERLAKDFKTVTSRAIRAYHVVSGARD